ncbi:MAG: formate--phosphoribosylaminoimidazolecarboxamide ligase [Euryarchaeota archaeon]|nr:formate--phosphoribosylaminoimidazolecarboxamide ligase [Euryarchaeota archaeon]
MILNPDIAKVLEGYDPKKLTIATVTSHSSLQIFHGAKQEGFRTLGITVGKPPRHYDAFPLSKPDRWLELKDYHELMDRADELVAENVILIPHGSFVEYMGGKNYEKLPVPSFGNKQVLEWESNRTMEREWLHAAGLTMPEEIKDPKDIIQPVIVKYHGAKGGRGFFIAKNYHEFMRKIEKGQSYTIQEFVLGTRYYLHYFFSPLREQGYSVDGGILEMLSMDRRDEANIDEANRLGSINELEAVGISPTFVVTGNIPIVLRESLLPKVFDMGEKVVKESIKRFGGLVGPFCLETVVTDQLEFKVFEISARIVAGTNPYITGSPYMDLIEPNLSTGRRIAQEIRLAADAGRLGEVCS